MGTPNVTDKYRRCEEATSPSVLAICAIIRGTADHTVYYQQSMMLVRALTDQGGANTAILHIVNKRKFELRLKRKRNVK
jgi:hypothetical protein